MKLPFEFTTPDVTTIIRWVLRATLVLFLTWFIRRRQDDDDEDAEEADAHESRHIPNNGKPRTTATRSGGPSQQQQYYQQRQDPHSYNNTMRQRRPEGGNYDVNAVIDKISKPKDLWEVRKATDGVNQIHKRSKATLEKKDDKVDKIPPYEEFAGGSLPPFVGGNGSGNSALSGLMKQSAAAKEKARKAREEEEKKTLHGHERPVTFITWNHDADLLFTCGKDKIVCAWTFPEGEQLGVYRGHSGAVWACSVTTDSKWLVTSGADRLVLVWEARTANEVARMELPGVVRFVEWASVGVNGVERFVTCHNRFASHPASLTVWRFDGTTIEEQLRITTLPTPASQVRWAIGDEELASCHENGELIFWKADTGAEVRRLQAHDAAITRFDFSIDREVVATASLDKSVKVWDLAGGSEEKLIFKTKTDRPLNAVALGPIKRGEFLAAPSERPQACSVIAAGGQDARDVAKSSGDSEQFGTLMYKLGSAEEFPGELQPDGVTKGHFGPVHTLAFARQGNAIASGSEDGCVRFHIFDTSAPMAKSPTT
mmetsp:Transcript_108282/g.305234  ORF Transcript_108282/g.305234 Transcript_108282/m.305234 type:complete len:542 (-) Transcript_108282:67-1692(-)